MTHEQATAYAKAHAYDGYTAYVMKDAHSLYSHTVALSQTSRAAREAQGWEVVETYVPQTLESTEGDAFPLYREDPYRIDGV